MKNLLFVLFLCLGLAACNEDSTTEPGNPIKNVELPSSALTAGQPVTIQGEGFVASDQIWLKAVAAKATENTLIQATVTEATTTSIIFTVPATAVGTFEILLQRTGVKHSLGNLTFNAVAQAKYYSFCYDETKMEFAEIDVKTGNVTWTGLKIPKYGSNSRGYVFNESNNELVCLSDNGVGDFHWVVSRLNVKSKEVVTTELKNLNGALNFRDIIKSSDNTYYAFCSDADKMELAEINVNTGNVTWPGLKIPEYGSNGRGYVFNRVKNELVCLSDNGTDGFNWIINRLDMDTKATELVELKQFDGVVNLGDIIQSNDNKFYAFCYDKARMELAEIDINTGNVTWTGLKIPGYGENGRGYVFDETGNELIALSDNATSGFHWVVSRLNMKTKEAMTLELKEMKDVVNLCDIVRF